MSSGPGAFRRFAPVSWVVGALVSGREGLDTLKVVMAVKQAAETGQQIQIH